MNYDQNWGMFIPAFLDHHEYFVERDPAVMVSCSNIHETGASLYLEKGFIYLRDQSTHHQRRVVFIALPAHSSGFEVCRDQTAHFVETADIRMILKQNHARLGSHHAPFFSNISYGYSTFSDGISIRPWMREMYAALVYPPPDSDLFEISDCPYSSCQAEIYRAFFSEEVLHSPACNTPGCHTDPSKVSYLGWMLKHVNGIAVFMEGAFYFSLIEQKIWQDRQDLQVVYPEPMGANFLEYKEWFSVFPLRERLIEQQMFQRWDTRWQFERLNHWKFHKQLRSFGDIGVNIYGWHLGIFSIGQIARMFVQMAKTVKMPFTAIEASLIGLKKFVNPKRAPYKITRSPCEPFNLVVMNADCTWIFDQDFPKVIRQNKYNIAFWTWELEIFPKKWMSALSSFDEIWCPSKFIKDSIEQSSGYDGTIVRVLPIPLNSSFTFVESDSFFYNGHSIAAGQTELNGTIHHKPFVFGAAFDFASISMRKNPEAVIRAFADAFPLNHENSNKYELLIHCLSGTTKDLGDLRRVAAGDPRVKFVHKVLTDFELKKLRVYQDCYVSLHRSEGYGMNILEAFSLGIPVIATNYSGNVDFFGPVSKFEGICSFPVPYKEMTLNQTYGPYMKGNRWADPDHKAAVDAMRRVSSNECRSRHGKMMSRLTMGAFGEAAVSVKMSSLLRQSFPRAMKKQDFTLWL
uniref:Glycosyl transferase family 1 domain-containing protein n=1 Tax=Heterosigma akashiwo TaxID=2829 RepID=A0A7S3XW28_HETAK